MKALLEILKLIPTIIALVRTAEFRAFIAKIGELIQNMKAQDVDTKAFLDSSSASFAKLLTAQSETEINDAAKSIRDLFGSISK